MQIATLGIDIGKTWFHVVALDAAGKPMLREKITERSSYGLSRRAMQA
jgi:predicted NBD/HSP70 family sugar kinase